MATRAAESIGSADFPDRIPIPLLLHYAWPTVLVLGRVRIHVQSRTPHTLVRPSLAFCRRFTVGRAPTCGTRCGSQLPKPYGHAACRATGADEGWLRQPRTRIGAHRASAGTLSPPGLQNVIAVAVAAAAAAAASAASHLLGALHAHRTSWRRRTRNSHGAARGAKRVHHCTALCRSTRGLLLSWTDLGRTATLLVNLVLCRRTPIDLSITDARWRCRCMWRSFGGG